MFNKIFQLFSKPDNKQNEKDIILEKLDKLEKQQQQLLDTHSKEESKENYTLSPKQLEYALSIINTLGNNLKLNISPETLTVKDLNRLVAYQKYKNKGALINLEKKGVLKKC
ncbi:ABC transporter ATP-binding protein [Cytobacillus gottheilii]|uniref:ABC transporter ATP-binding protein n=1 Tax=Cytobacillus gottheilii TaxID=859144 RepID=UPI0024959F17|nr:ABC transporter ATP-binding protein [Cytobacillus gottheilii]